MTSSTTVSRAHRPFLVRAVLVLFASASLVGCSLGPTAAASGTDYVLVGAGDIAGCGAEQMHDAEATAALLDRIPGTVFTLGDNIYSQEDGSEFGKCYQPSWGRAKDRTRPTLGNHDYDTPGASSYFAYFGAAGGAPGKGYYSYDLGTWHIVVLNSNCDDVACDAGSLQMQWLNDDLAAHPAACTLAMWHHPLQDSTPPGGSAPMVQPFWQVLYNFHADVVLNGHDHLYERFAPQNPDGRADPLGIREFIVGTGGAELAGRLQQVPKGPPNSEVIDGDTFGVLKLTLHADSYSWQFVPVSGETFTDSGSAQCHGRGNS